MVRHSASLAKRHRPAARCPSLQQHGAARRVGRCTHAISLALIGKTAPEVLADYVEIIELVEPTGVPRVVTGDIDDDQVIAAAVSAPADLIASGDRKHLLPLVAIKAFPSSMPLRPSGASATADTYRTANERE